VVGARGNFRSDGWTSRQPLMDPITEPSPDNAIVVMESVSTHGDGAQNETQSNASSSGIQWQSPDVGESDSSNAADDRPVSSGEWVTPKKQSPARQTDANNSRHGTQDRSDVRADQNALPHYQMNVGRQQNSSRQQTQRHEESHSDATTQSHSHGETNTNTSINEDTRTKTQVEQHTTTANEISETETTATETTATETTATEIRSQQSSESSQSNASDAVMRNQAQDIRSQLRALPEIEDHPAVSSSTEAKESIREEELDSLQEDSWMDEPDDAGPDALADDPVANKPQPPNTIRQPVTNPLVESVPEDAAPAKKASPAPVRVPDNRVPSKTIQPNPATTPARQAKPAEQSPTQPQAEPKTTLRPMPKLRQRPTITPAIQQMKQPIQVVLQHHYNRPENAAQRSNWGMFHQIMIFGTDTQIAVGGRGRRYNAVAWMSGNQICQRDRLFTADQYGILPRSGTGLQGHQGQMLAIYGLIGVPSSYPLVVGKKRYTVRDVVAREMADCRSDTELSFTLIGLSRYIETDATWTARDGSKWNFERILELELAQPIAGAACGGTHRLMALAHALNARRSEKRPITGHWKRAELYLNDYVQHCYQLQNADGSFSTNWLEGRENRNDIARKIQTSGHIVEFLLSLTPDSQLSDPRLTRAMQFLTFTMYRDRKTEWAVGPRGHALRSLMLYHKRMYNSTTPWRTRATVAARPSVPSSTPARSPSRYSPPQNAVSYRGTKSNSRANARRRVSYR
ncbi:MAG: hypothetical protein AAFP69_17790, partial [Planctomycetota bacterium]